MDEKPDVEAIIVEIQQRIREAGLKVTEPVPEGVPEDDLQNNLRQANESVHGGDARTPGWVRSCRRLMFRILGLNRFHSSLVRVLNDVIRILSGEKTPGAAGLLAENRARQELLERQARRLDAYEAEHIPERLRTLEAELRRLKGETPK